MCRQPAIRAPFRGFVAPYFLRRAISPGISFSASSISLRPHSARDRSLTLYGSDETAGAEGISASPCQIWNCVLFLKETLAERYRSLRRRPPSRRKRVAIAAGSLRAAAVIDAAERTE